MNRTQNSPHYHPFGMRMWERSSNSSTYRYGFNGMEKDEEIKGEGNSYDFGARMYDPRIGRWMSIDPLYKEFPFQSDYSSFNNNPIFYIDLNGESGVSLHEFVDGFNGYRIHVSQKTKEVIITKTEVISSKIHSGGFSIPRAEVQWRTDSYVINENGEITQSSSAISEGTYVKGGNTSTSWRSNRTSYSITRRSRIAENRNSNEDLSSDEFVNSYAEFIKDDNNSADMFDGYFPGSSNSTKVGTFLRDAGPVLLFSKTATLFTSLALEIMDLQDGAEFYSDLIKEDEAEEIVEELKEDSN